MLAEHPLPALPGSLGAAVDAMAPRVVLHDLYDSVGAAVYDDSTQVDPAEIRWLRRHLPAGTGSVLELAAGNGRLTEPLLKMGIRTTALELSPAMLEQLRHRVDDLAPRHRDNLAAVHCADMTDFALGEEFDAILLMAASISLLDLEGRGRLFDRVREHLAPDGEFAFSIAAEATHEDAAEPLDLVVDVTGRSGTSYRIHQFRAPGSSSRVIGVYPLPTEGDTDVPVCTSTHRVLSVDDVLDQMSRHGLRVVERVAAPATDVGVAEVFVRAVRG